MRLPTYFLGLCAGAGLLACSSSETTTATIVRPQLLSVSPDDFMGTLPCRPDFATGGAGGASAAAAERVAKSYVATVRDVTLKDVNNPSAGTVDFDLPSSPPTPCSQPVTFSYVIADHYYVAHVDAYAQNARDLQPFALGSPLLLDAQSGERVSARWTADCSDYPISPAGGGGGIGGSSSGGATGGGGGNPGVRVFDTITQTPHDCTHLQ